MLSEIGFDGDFCGVSVLVGEQLIDIVYGVDSVQEYCDGLFVDLFDGFGVGDQGIMFGFVINEILQLMLMVVWMVYCIVEWLIEVCCSGVLFFFCLDGKIQVILGYEGFILKIIDVVVVFIQYYFDILQSELQVQVCEYVIDFVFEMIGFDFVDVIYYINFVGFFVMGGFKGDVGFIGCKIIIDIYGGVVCYGGGVFSGKDLLKVDCFGVYVICWVVKNVVVVGFVNWFEVQVVYVIGVVCFVGFYVEMFGIGKVFDEVIICVIIEVFDLCLQVIIEQFDFLCLIYVQIVVYGYFGCELLDFIWECIDCIEELCCVVGF